MLVSPLNKIRSDEAVRIGSPARAFSLKTQEDADWDLTDQLGSVVVLLFYPQNETLVCNRQLCSVRDNWEVYLETKAVIVGISPATPAEHQVFASRRRLPITLLSDPGRRVTTIYGKHGLLPIRLTRAVVVIDAKGVVRSRDVMPRVFRPSDKQLVTDVYSARGDALTEECDRLRERIKKIRLV